MSANKSDIARENWEALRRAAGILSKQFEDFGDVYHGCLAMSESAGISTSVRDKYKAATAETQRASNTALALCTALEGYMDLAPEAARLLRAATDASKQEGAE